MSDPEEKKDKKETAIPTDVPESAFEEALKAIENLQKQKGGEGKARKKPRQPQAEDQVFDQDDSESLAGLFKILDQEETKSEKAPVAKEQGRDNGKSDLDLLAELLEEEQNLEKEAEFLKSVLLEAQAAPMPVGDAEAIKKKEGQIQELQDRLLRIQAEFDNFKKRINRDKVDMVRFSNENLILSVLPIIDNFERAISHAAATDDSQATIDGVRLILKQLHDTLQANGVRKIDATNQVFDPAYHEAMATIATNDFEPGHVIAQHEPGYILYSRLLRPAKVVVSVNPSEENEEKESHGASEPIESQKVSS